MCDIVLEKPISCSASSWEAMWVPLCTSSSQMWLFPQRQIPRILAAEWVQNLTWSETCAYKNLLPLNSWCILGALMCEVPSQRPGWQHLWASLAHPRSHPRLLKHSPACSRVPWAGAWGCAEPAPPWQQLSSANPGAGPGGAQPPRLLSQGKPCQRGSSWGRELTCWELQPEQRTLNGEQGWAQTASLMTFPLTLLLQGSAGHQHTGSSHLHNMLHQASKVQQGVARYSVDAWVTVTQICGTHANEVHWGVSILESPSGLGWKGP